MDKMNLVIKIMVLFVIILFVKIYFVDNNNIECWSKGQYLYCKESCCSLDPIFCFCESKHAHQMRKKCSFDCETAKFGRVGSELNGTHCQCENLATGFIVGKVVKRYSNYLNSWHACRAKASNYNDSESFLFEWCGKFPDPEGNFIEERRKENRRILDELKRKHEEKEFEKGKIVIME